MLIASWQERLLIAAKARISRMVAPKTRRKELEVPEFVKNHWSGNKDEMAHLLLNLNFDKARLILLPIYIYIYIHDPERAIHIYRSTSIPSTLPATPTPALSVAGKVHQSAGGYHLQEAEVHHDRRRGLVHEG